MVKCESCGVVLSEGVKFCSRCGVPVGVKEEFTVRPEDLVGKIKDLIQGRRFKNYREGREW